MPTIASCAARADVAFTLYDMLDAIGGAKLGTQAITVLYKEEADAIAAGLDWSQYRPEEHGAHEDGCGCGEHGDDHECGCGHHHGEDHECCGGHGHDDGHECCCGHPSRGVAPMSWTFVVLALVLFLFASTLAFCAASGRAKSASSPSATTGLPTLQARRQSSC